MPDRPTTMRADDDHIHVSLFRILNDCRGDRARDANGWHRMQVFAVGLRQ